MKQYYFNDEERQEYMNATDQKTSTKILLKPLFRTMRHFLIVLVILVLFNFFLKAPIQSFYDSFKEKERLVEEQKKEFTVTVIDKRIIPRHLINPEYYVTIFKSDNGKLFESYNQKIYYQLEKGEIVKVKVKVIDNEDIDGFVKSLTDIEK